MTNPPMSWKSRGNLLPFLVLPFSLLRDHAIFEGSVSSIWRVESMHEGCKSAPPVHCSGSHVATYLDG